MDIFNSIFEAEVATNVSISNFLICMATAFIVGLILAKMHCYKTKGSKGFIVTLVIIPIVVTMIIIMVNGNIGTGVAVAGAFSLIRFRSVPGTAKEIGSIFIAMGAGITIGMGYIGFAILFTIIACTITHVLSIVDFGKQANDERILTISIPESLNYVDGFDDIFNKYTKKFELITVKSTNMGSTFKLTYEIELKNKQEEKQFVDDLRCRNGNLDILITRQEFLNSTL
ncbi:MAG: DUF4956 domain-containing protein [Epulopiscium sp. Nuni2H_MBin003]|nr:MAG: DUF4956 domain-containing protein [Epulopiscium sp. Nuni2H_MBin003]